MLGWDDQGLIGAKSVSCRVRVVAMTGRDAGGKVDGDGWWEGSENGSSTRVFTCCMAATDAGTGAQSWQVHSS
jgi:hypothetical protein